MRVPFITTTFCPRLAPLADHGPGHDVAEMPDLRARADLRALVHVRGRVYENAVAHAGTCVSDASSKSACHSCNERTRLRRERSERMASDAAFAADMVVV